MQSLVDIISLGQERDAYVALYTAMVKTIPAVISEEQDQVKAVLERMHLRVLRMFNEQLQKHASELQADTKITIVGGGCKDPNCAVCSLGK
jgi:recombinational DNA repair protein (RecF pathway)